MGKPDDLSQSVRWARKRWRCLPPLALDALKQLVTSHGFSIVMGDLLFLNGAWYVTHIGLPRLPQRRSCAGIRVQALPDFCDSGSSQWAFNTTVFKSQNCRGFVSYGDANPSNVSRIVHG